MIHTARTSFFVGSRKSSKKRGKGDGGGETFKERARLRGRSVSGDAGLSPGEDEEEDAGPVELGAEAIGNANGPRWEKTNSHCTVYHIQYNIHNFVQQNFHVFQGGGKGRFPKSLSEETTVQCFRNEVSTIENNRILFVDS